MRFSLSLAALLAAPMLWPARLGDYLRAVAASQDADAFINTHGYQSALFYHLRRLKADPNAPNPLLMGADGVDLYLGVFADCQRAVRQRLADGAWQAW